MRPLPGAPALVGTVVGGRYRVIQLLGSGGTGDVYLAERVYDGAAVHDPRPKPRLLAEAFRESGRERVGDAPASGPRGRVAIKVLQAEHRGDRELGRRFRREAEAVAEMRHPNVLEVVAPPFESDGVLCFVMELLVGLDLADTLAYSRSLGSPRAVGITVGAADGLAAAHAVGVVHRDVKPENIFLVHAADGREAVKLLDFGFAWMPGDEAPSARLSALGTPEYMAPEQAQGAPARPTADVYSLGIVLYEMLAGRAPFGGNYPAIAREHAERPLPPIRSFNPGAALSPELEAVVARALAKAPAARFASMGELRRALLGTPEAAGRAL